MDTHRHGLMTPPKLPLASPPLLTFDFQADLIFSFAQDVGGHAGVDALVLFANHLDFETAVFVDVVVTTIQVASLPILKPHNRAANTAY